LLVCFSHGDHFWSFLLFIARSNLGSEEKLSFKDPIREFYFNLILNVLLVFIRFKFFQLLFKLCGVKHRVEFIHHFGKHLISDPGNYIKLILLLLVTQHSEDNCVSHNVPLLPKSSIIPIPLFLCLRLRSVLQVNSDTLSIRQCLVYLFFGMGDFKFIILYQQVWNVNSRWVMILPKEQTGCGCYPVNKLVALATLNLIVSG